MTPTEDRIARVANNTILLLVSRLAMAATPFVATLLVYLGSFYLETRFDQSRAAISAVNATVQVVQAQANAASVALTDLKVQQVLIQQAAALTDTVNANWRMNVNARLDKATDAIINLTAGVASLNTAVQLLSK